MKNRIYAISLLLSFLVVMSHEMIPHHHHDEVALNFSISYKQDDHKHKHPPNKEHRHNHDSQKEEKSTEHNHPIPPHHHFSAANDVYIVRTNPLESNTQLRDVSFCFFTKLFRIEFLKPPNLEVELNKEPPFLISSLSFLEAFTFRGPPAIV